MVFCRKGIFGDFMVSCRKVSRQSKKEEPPSEDVIEKTVAEPVTSEPPVKRQVSAPVEDDYFDGRWLVF